MDCCDTCAYLSYDEEYEEYVCDINLDEDEMARMMSGTRRDCPFYRNGDEYLLARRQ